MPSLPEEGIINIAVDGQIGMQGMFSLLSLVLISVSDVTIPQCIHPLLMPFMSTSRCMPVCVQKLVHNLN